MRVAEIRELQGRDTFVVKNIGLYPVVGVESGGCSCGGAGRGEAVDRDEQGHGPGRRALTGPVCVAAVVGGARPGQDHLGSGGVRGPGRSVPV